MENELVDTKAELRTAVGENEFFVSKLTVSRQDLDAANLENQKLRQQVEKYAGELKNANDEKRMLEVRNCI